MNTSIEKQFYDQVVDGYNIKWIQYQYSRVLNKEGNYVLGHMNIKHFRFYNSHYGFSIGDEILKIIYATLSNFLTDAEYIGHDTADNFLIIFKYDNLEDFMNVRMMDLMEVLYRIPGERLYRNNFESFGLFPMTSQDISFQEAYSLANIARLEEPNINNRSHTFELYTEELFNNYLKRKLLENNTAEAFFNYEFSPYLQPKVNPKTNEIIGAETLIRWKGKDGNFIPLNDFLPILTNNSYIVAVDLDLFDMVCKQLDERIKQNKKVVPISFNLSKQGFYNMKALNDYLNIFNKYDIPPNLIEFELMESISFGDTKQLGIVIKKLKDAGFSCSLDDFGNGFSSFNVLLNANLDTIKIDRQFFLKNTNGDNKLIIKTITDLIKSLNMKMVAEGVETKDYVDFLVECDCDAIQGFYYYKPMPSNEFFKLLD